MTFTSRALGTYAILLIGNWFIMAGMAANNADDPRIAAYALACLINRVLLAPLVIAGGLYVAQRIQLIISAILEEKAQKEKERQWETETNERYEERNRQRDIEERIKAKIEREEKLKAEALRLREQERIHNEQLRVMKERKERSLEDAAKSALDDF